MARPKFSNKDAAIDDLEVFYAVVLTVDIFIKSKC
jgi:hypothetical protein